MKCIVIKKKEDVSPAPILLVRGTRGIKTLVMKATFVTNTGVAMVIKNALSLSVDQAGKTCDASKSCENVFPINLNQAKKRGRESNNILCRPHHDPSNSDQLLFFLIV